MKKAIKIGGAVLVLCISSGAGAYFYFGDQLLGAEPAVDEEGEPVVEEPVLDPPLYHAMPALIVSANYQGRLRYLQVKLSIMTRNEETLDKLDVNTPLLQDALIMLLNEYPFDKLETPAGKEEFRERSLLRVQEVIADEQVESLLFTGFVIQ
ncbi:MAG: flagellar basal body-associated FliL family protein [Pseudohongiellaceae bacterium]|jgi:flagellar FliL protein